MYIKRKKDPARYKTINGEKYIFMDGDAQKEIWVPLSSMGGIPSCYRCGYSGIALDKHHVHGRKKSDETIDLCSNCHREYHNGEWSL